jgi:hypothetical protein
MEVREFDEGAAVEKASKIEDAQPDIVQLIQLHALRHDPVTLTIESAKHQMGWLCLDRGDVVRATTAGGKSGFEAFVEIISWEEPSVANVHREVVDTPNIALPLPKLLIEAFWEAQCHVSDDPSCDDLPPGLEEDTVTGKSEFGPPDGVTKTVIETAQRLSRMKGFVAVSLICAPTGALIETLGDRSQMTMPDWLGCISRAQREDPELEHAVFTTGKFIDILCRPVGDTDVSYFLRMDRTLTNRGLLEVGLRQAREQAKD